MEHMTEEQMMMLHPEDEAMLADEMLAEEYQADHSEPVFMADDVQSDVFGA
jgi:hypothetical protein